MLYILIALISGSLVILSMVVNSQLAERIGVFQGTCINYLGGLILISIILLLKRDFSNLSFEIFSGIPVWAYLGGVVGVMIVAISNIIIPKIPAIYSTLLIFLGQLFTGMVIDSLSGNVISIGKIIGGIFIIGGLLYNFNIDKKQAINNEQI